MNCSASENCNTFRSMSLPENNVAGSHTHVQPRAPFVPTVDPTREELAVLSAMERFAFRTAHRANQGRAKEFWTRLQSWLGAWWIHLSTYNIMRVYGLEHTEAIDHTRPLILVANHHSFFDMYCVSAVLYRRTRWKKRLFFPVRGRFFYTSPLGMFVNLVMGWWSMYPPFFYTTEKRAFDKYAVRRLATLCHQGAGNIIGFHPEGTRNKSHDPYSFLPAQPGIGKLIMDARPQVVPVFIGGLGNYLFRQIIRNWTGGEQIRIHFGAPLALEEFYSKRNALRTHKEVAEHVMSSIAALGDEDRRLQLAARAGRTSLNTSANFK